MNALSSQETRPRLLFFYDPKDGNARRVEAYLAQILQRRRNHDTFQIHRIDIHTHPNLVERFRIDRTPSICVITKRRLALRAVCPKGAQELQHLLAPWLR
jgi:thioredoxin-like negative regulator of GroEL